MKQLKEMLIFSEGALKQTNLPLPVFKRGKVRDIYDLGEKLLIVATDRISAFDYPLDPPIPMKGAILTKFSKFWFKKIDIVENHLLSTPLTDIEKLTELPKEMLDFLEQRSMIVKKCEVIPFECVVRGYLAGSGYRDYKKTGKVCGIALPAGLKKAAKLQEPIFTPATKSDTGDLNVDFAYMQNKLGKDLATQLKDISIKIYLTGYKYAYKKGFILADTKLEFGLLDGKVILVDELLTPDSSRYWDVNEWEEGKEPNSFDKEFVRKWLKDNWDKNSPPPKLPREVVEGTKERYTQALKRITTDL